MLDYLQDSLLDTVKLLPYLFVTFLVLELLEHKFSKKTEKVLSESKKYGPIVGGILGGLPQCGFSSMAAGLFSSGVITMGTLIAVFLSTSDEMLPIMISEKVDISLVLKIIGFKIIIGIIVGFIVDFFYKKGKKHIHDLCEQDHCHCEDGVFLSTMKHTLKTGFFILIANFLLNFIIGQIGEEHLEEFLLQKNILTYFSASLIGLIPNCASSVVLTQLYLSKLLSIGNLLSGLLTGSGLGILLLFKNNRNKKENFIILGIIYFVGVFVGFLVDLFL